MILKNESGHLLVCSPYIWFPLQMFAHIVHLNIWRTKLNLWLCGWPPPPHLLCISCKAVPAWSVGSLHSHPLCRLHVTIATLSSVSESLWLHPPPPSRPTENPYEDRNQRNNQSPQDSQRWSLSPSRSCHSSTLISSFIHHWGLCWERPQKPPQRNSQLSDPTCWTSV